MRKGVIATISVFAIGFLVVIAGFFLLDIERVALNFWAFGSLLFSLAVSLVATLTIVMPKINKDNIFYNAGVISAIWIYEIFVVISIIFTNYFKGHVGTFILLQLVINALFFIALILITRASVHIHDINEKAYEKKQNGLYDKPKRGGF